MMDLDSAKTFEEFKEILKSYEIKTFSKFNVYQNHKGFLDEKREISANWKLFWKDGLPYYHFGSRIYTCHLGKDKNLGKKRKYMEEKLEKAKSDHVFQKTYNLTQTTKKLDCPASIKVTRVCTLPQFKLENPTKSKKMAISEKIKRKLRNNEDVEGEEVFWFMLPSVDAHKNHMPAEVALGMGNVGHRKRPRGPRGLATRGQTKKKERKKKKKEKKGSLVPVSFTYETDGGNAMGVDSTESPFFTSSLRRMNFEGRVAIITGGARGIGKAIAKILLDNGMKISVCDIDESAGQSFREELSGVLKEKVIFQKCDVSSNEEFRAVFVKTKSEFGRIDVVINNAGLLNESQWKRMIEVNFIGVINGIHLAFEFMGTNYGGEGGSIINIASNTGLAGFDLAPIYSGTKHGVVGLTRSYSAKYHFDKTSVTVNAVCPIATNTDLLKAYPKNALDEEAAIKQCATLEPISADDVAKAVLKLLKDGKNGALLFVKEDGVEYVE